MKKSEAIETPKNEINIHTAEVNLFELVKRLARELRPGQPLPPSTTMDSRLDKDLGIDSLGRVELLARIERHFDVSLPERVFTSAETPRDLLRAILSATAHRKAAHPLKVGVPSLEEAEVAPESAQTLIEVLNWHVLHHPDRPHIRFYNDIDDGEVLTYRELQDGALAVARGLQNLGLTPGQSVTLMLPTCKEYFLSFYGVLFAGGIPVPIYPPMRMTQLEDHLHRQMAILNNSQTVILITVQEAKHLGQLLRSQVESLHSVTTTKELASIPGHYQEPIIRGEDIAFLQYTSGSTGTPKGVILTHNNLLANIRADGKAIEATPADVFISWLPLYHDMGLIGAWLGTLYFAAQLVIMSPLSFLTRPQRWLWAIHRYRGTLSAAPNFA